MRSFYKISLERFKKEVINQEDNYQQFFIPKRNTKNSAGYDFFSPIDVIIKKGEIVKIPTGIKVSMNEDEVLFLVVRSSMGFNYNIRMCNQIGVIDSDYYNNSFNEGHIYIALQNEGNKDFFIKKMIKYVKEYF